MSTSINIPASVPTMMLAAALLGLSACGDVATLDLEFSAQESSSNALTLDSGIEVERLVLQLREIKILPDRADEGDGEGEAADKYMARGTFTLDLLDPAASVVPDIELEPARYKKIEFKVDKPGNGTGIDGTNASMWLEGSKDGVHFRYMDERMDKITLRDVEGIDLSGDTTQSFVVDLHVNSWLDGIDMAGLQQEDGVALLVDDAASGNRSAFRDVEDNVKAAIKLLRRPKRP